MTEIEKLRQEILVLKNVSRTNFDKLTDAKRENTIFRNALTQIKDRDPKILLTEDAAKQAIRNFDVATRALRER